MRNIKVEQITQTPIEKQEIEIVERKGIGHPDSMADGFAEAVSKALSEKYIEKFGVLLHENTDQVEIVAGQSLSKFGGGEILSPIYVLLSGQATTEFNGVKIPVNIVAINAAKRYLKTVLPDINPDNVVFDCRISPGSSDLTDIFNRGKAPMANDTSFGVGHAPFSELENIVYRIENEMIVNLKKEFPAIGSDIKIMGMRKKNHITITIACAMIGKYIKDVDEYFRIKNILNKRIFSFITTLTYRNIEVFINTGDDEKTSSVYLTVMGTSAENGDTGSVGRGNRCNGIITPGRPMSMEACSGKNFINHTGKIYNLLANKLANRIYKDIEGIGEVHTKLLSQIGCAINYPLIASAQIIMKDGYEFNEIKNKCENIINDELENITQITEMLLKGELQTF